MKQIFKDIPLGLLIVLLKCILQQTKSQKKSLSLMKIIALFNHHLTNKICQSLKADAPELNGSKITSRLEAWEGLLVKRE
jgi:hypothetical protein